MFNKKSYNLNMSDNNDKKENKEPVKGSGQNKPDDNFDWSKVIRLVFGWGAVIVAAVIVMQVFRTGTANYVEIPYNQYEKLLNEDKIEKAVITKSDVNDYYLDRKSTRLNSSHVRISYAVFCLKKKK